MRDVKRIDRICKKLANLWKCYPDERFGQLITNHIFDDRDPFHVEDTRERWMGADYVTWEDKIDKVLERHKLWERVCKETNYRKDYDAWDKKYWKIMRSFNLSYLDPQSRNESEKEKILERHRDLQPKWEDYIGELK